MGLTLSILLVVICIVAIVILTSKLKCNVFGSLFVVSAFLALFTLPIDKVVSTLKSSFGSTMGSISFVIIFGTLIAVFMQKSGGTLSIASHILNKTGTRNAKQAMAITGFIPGLTIFCDSGFIILSGIARSFSAQSKTAMPLMAAILSTSLFAVHCLVPTHPGALGAANELNASIGYLVVAGVLFAIPGIISAYLWASWMCKGKNYAPAVLEAHEQTDTPLPPFVLSLMPVVLPLILISISGVTLAMGYKTQNFAKIIHFFGDPSVALFIGALAGAYLLFQSRKGERINYNEMLDEAIAKAGPILIITAAGGMFGAIIKETGIASQVGSSLSGTAFGLLIPFVISAILKTAQGSSTIAALTTAGIVSPLLASFGLDSEMGRVFTVLAIGAGSAIVSHANDSYFWVTTKFSNIEAEESIRVFTSSTLVMGATMFACIWAVSFFVL